MENNFSMIYEGYFNDVQTSSDELIDDIEQSNISDTDEITPENYDVLIIVALDSNAESTIKNHPEWLNQTRNNLYKIIDSLSFITKHSNVYSITRYKELESSEIGLLYDNEFSTMSVCLKFAFSCNLNNIMNIYRMFAIMSQIIHKHFGIYDFKIFNDITYESKTPKWCDASYFSRDRQLVDVLKNKTVYNKTKDHALFLELIWLGLAFKKDLKTYNILTNKFGPEAQLNYISSEMEEIAHSWADYQETKHYKVKLPASFYKKLNNCQITTTYDFSIQNYDVERTDSMNLMVDDKYQKYVTEELSKNPRKINNIVIKQLDNYTRIVIYIPLGPFYHSDDDILFESALLLNEVCYRERDILIVSECLFDLCSHQIPLEEIKNTLTKYLHKSESL